MNKLVIFIMSISMFIQSGAFSLLEGCTNYFKEADLCKTRNVEFIHSNDTLNSSDIEEFVSGGGVIISKGSINSNVTNNLKIPVEVDELHHNTGEADIATLYFNYEDGKKGVYVISGKQSDSNVYTYIEEALDNIENIKLERNVAISATSSCKEFIASVTTDVVTYIPKGKLTVNYDLYTAQNLYDYDYYVIKATLIGKPGCVMYNDGNTNYQKKYYGLGMKSKMTASSTGVTVYSSGPSSTVNSNSYSINLGPILQKEASPQFQVILAYTRNISNFDITESTLANSNIWEVDLNGDDKRKQCKFEPAAAFKCSTVKQYIEVNLYTSYDVDSLDTFKTHIVSDRTIRIYPTYYVFK